MGLLVHMYCKKNALNSFSVSCPRAIVAESLMYLHTRTKAHIHVTNLLLHFDKNPEEEHWLDIQQNGWIHKKRLANYSGKCLDVVKQKPRTQYELCRGSGSSLYHCAMASFKDK